MVRAGPRTPVSWPAGPALTPTVRGSDLTVRHGHISKQGSAWLRWVLNQAAQTAKRSPESSATYTAIAKRRGKKIAIIATSRKLLTRAYHLLAATRAAQVTSTPGTAGHPPADHTTVAKPRARSGSENVISVVIGLDRLMLPGSRPPPVSGRPRRCG